MSCLTREQINAEAWLQSGLPGDLCTKYPELKQYGLYRELNDGHFENIFYCQQETDGSSTAQKYTSFNTQKLNDLLDKNLPKAK